MASWQQKKINCSQTLAEKIKQARLAAGLELTSVSKKINIPIKYLELLEAGEYHALPGDIYAKAWLKKYAQILSLNIEDLLVDFHIEKNINKKINDNYNPKKKHLNWIWLRPYLLRWIMIVLVAGVLLSYLVWEIFKIIKAPDLVLLEPATSHKTMAASIDISGRTEPEVQLSVNGEQILLDNQGYFKKNINLALGLNNLEISAKKKHSRTRYLQVVILRENVD
jgi:cytoskeletal protein RodZ